MPSRYDTERRPAPSDPTAQPTNDPTTEAIATVLGIMMGDDYGAHAGTELHPTTPKPIPTQELPGDQAYDPDALVMRGENPKAVEPPDHGGTIYSGSFAHDLLAAINMPVTYENVRFVNAWMKAETGDQGPGTPAFNPLATTQNYHGGGSYTIFNSVGVKNYSDYHTGVMATADVLLRQPKNAPILAALARGTDALAAARAVSASGWGTGLGVLKILGGQ